MHKSLVKEEGEEKQNKKTTTRKRKNEPGQKTVDRGG